MCVFPTYKDVEKCAVLNGYPWASFAFLVFPGRINSALVWFYCSKKDHSASLVLTSEETDINFCWISLLQGYSYLSICFNPTWWDSSALKIPFISTVSCAQKGRDVVGGGSSYNSGSHSVPFSEGLPTAILLKHFIKIHLFFFYIH